MYEKIVNMGITRKTNIAIASGLVIRILLSLTMYPKLAQNMYIPFLQNQTNPFDFSFGVESSESRQSPFPYGIPMYILFMPVFAAVKVTASNSLTIFVRIAICIITLIPDFLIIIFLRKNTQDLKASLLWVFSPIVLWSTYYSGQTDLWPALLFAVSCYLLANKKRYAMAGAVLGLAIGCKYGVGIVIPFILVFMFDNPRYKQQIKKFLTSASVVTFLSYLPLLYSSDFRILIFRSESSSEILALFIDFQNFQFYLVPAIYLLLLVWIYRAGRTTISVLVIFISVAIVSIAILTPASFGWVIWALPALLVFLDIRSSRLFWVLIIFQALYFAAKSGALVELGLSASNQWISTLNTLLIVFSIFLLIRLLQHGVSQGDVYRLAARPFQVAIAGDSGVGKDTCAKAISTAFGADATLVICGDDYHRFERGDFIWGTNTHLNPGMNNLQHWSRDLKKAVRREHFQSQEYDHINGRFSKKGVKKKSDLVISQGLHALYPEVSRDFDAKIFLDMDIELRLALKMKRDTTDRKRSESEVLRQLELRTPDFSKYIQNQVQNADLIVKLIPDDQMSIRFIEMQSSKHESILSKLELLILSYSPESLLFTAEGNKGVLRIDSKYLDSASVEGILKNTLKSFAQFFPTDPSFSAGVNGVLQLVTFMVIEENRSAHGGIHDSV